MLTLRNVGEKDMNYICKGNTAEIFEYGDKRVCKLFYPNYPLEYIQHEFSNSELSCMLGINTPKAYDIITQNDRHGIVFDRVDGDMLSSKVFTSDNPYTSNWIDKFADFHMDLLKHNLDEAMSYKDFLKLFATEEEIIQMIDALEDGNCFLHGDLHLDNVMVNGANQFVLIDMMNVCKGPVLYDVARTYFLLGYDENIQSIYLHKMGYSINDIKPYLDVILKIREKEKAPVN